MRFYVHVKIKEHHHTCDMKRSEINNGGVRVTRFHHAQKKRKRKTIKNCGKSV